MNILKIYNEENMKLLMICMNILKLINLRILHLIIFIPC